MPISNTHSATPDPAAPAVPTSPGDGGGLALGWLRAELAATPDPTRQARLLADIAEAEEKAGDPAGALRDFLLAHEADPSLREPLESLAEQIENNISFKEIRDVVEALIDTSLSPDERVQALLLRALHERSSPDDSADALASIREAVNVEGAAPAERATATLALELLAGDARDSTAREEALAGRVQFASDPTWRALLLIDQARIAAEKGEVDTALGLLAEAKAQNSRATWTALTLEDELLRVHPGLPGTTEAGDRAERRARTLDAMGTLVRTGTADPAWGDAFGLPRWVREKARAADLWLTAGSAQGEVGKRDAAASALESAQSVVDTMSPPEKSVSEAIVTHARIRLADVSGNLALAAELAAKALPHESDGPRAAALALRIAQQAAAEGSRNAALDALEQALRHDPTSLPARVLQLDVLAHGDDMGALAAQLETAAEQLETDEARATAFLVAAYVWAALAGDPSSAKAALSQASILGAAPQVTGFLARTLASLQGDSGWYEDATRRLLVAREADAPSAWLGLELIALRDARNDSDGASKALRDLGELPEGRWMARVLEAFAPAARKSPEARATAEVAASAFAALRDLAVQEPDLQWAAAIGLAVAMRAHAAGDPSAARQQLREIATRKPDDLFVASYLGYLDRDAGDWDAASKTASNAGAAATDPELAATFYLEAGLEKWRAGDRAGAVALFEMAVPRAPAAARLMLSWARWGANPDDLEKRRQALVEAAALQGADAALSLERFATEVAVGNTDAAGHALAEADAGQNDALSLASALARLVWPDAANSPLALQQALERLAARGPEAALVAAAERVRIARESQDVEQVAQASRVWFEAGGALPAALEWIAAAVVLGDAREEMQARLAAASCLSGDARAALMARAALVHPRVDFDQHAPLVPGDSPIIRLANLDLSPPVAIRAAGQPCSRRSALSSARTPGSMRWRSRRGRFSWAGTSVRRRPPSRTCSRFAPTTSPLGRAFALVRNRRPT